MPTKPGPRHYLDALRQSFDDFARKTGGVCTVANGPESAALEILAQSNDAWRVILLWRGDEAHPDSEARIVQVPVCRYRLAVIVCARRPLSPDQNMPTMKASPAGSVPSLLDLVPSVRAFALGLVFNPATYHGGRLFYGGCDAVALQDGTPLDAYEMTFSFWADIEPPAAEAVTVDIAAFNGEEN